MVVYSSYTISIESCNASLEKQNSLSTKLSEPARLQLSSMNLPVKTVALLVILSMCSLPAVDGQLRVAAFNIQNFGTKMFEGNYGPMVKTVVMKVSVHVHAFFVFYSTV